MTAKLVKFSLASWLREIELLMFTVSKLEFASSRTLKDVKHAINSSALYRLTFFSERVSIF